MSKYIVCVFDNEKAAYDGARAVLALETEGGLTVYEGAIIAKDENGRVRILDENGEGPFHTGTGMLLGSLIGIIAGPAGMAVGAAFGALGGALLDMNNIGVGDDFLVEVGKELTAGKSAIVAEVTEVWTVPLDTRMEALGAEVYRENRIDVEDEQIERSIEAASQDLDDLKAEWKQASGEAKQKAKAKMDAAKAKLKELDEKAKAKWEAIKQEPNAKTKKLEAQIAKADVDMKEKYKTHRETVKAKNQERMEKLKAAAKLAGEALA